MTGSNYVKIDASDEHQSKESEILQCGTGLVASELSANNRSSALTQLVKINLFPPGGKLLEGNMIREFIIEVNNTSNQDRTIALYFRAIPYELLSTEKLAPSDNHPTRYCPNLDLPINSARNATFEFFANWDGRWSIYADAYEVNSTNGLIGHTLRDIQIQDESTWQQSTQTRIAAEELRQIVLLGYLAIYASLIGVAALAIVQSTTRVLPWERD